MMNGSRRPRVPSVEASTGWPALCTSHVIALLPFDVASEIFSPAIVSAVKYANR
ncbi:hypothetical protein D3C87_1724220 [compost metagenome]